MLQKNTMLSRMVFVILHYMNKEDTIECVESIKSNINYGNKMIVVVDNASPNGSGIELKNQYRGSNDIYVLLNDQNGGFAQGNNLGFAFAKNQLCADFIVCLNNDVVIKQSSFCDVVNQLYGDYQFDVLGPDIITKDGYHQNPLVKKIYTSRDLAVMKAKKNARRILNEVGLDIYIEKNRSTHKKIYLSETVPGETFNCGLHGACVIFSKNFISKSDYAFYKDTFMYFEEDILFLQAHYLNYLTCYSGKVQVFHKEYGATQIVFENYKSRKRNYYKNIIASIDVYKRMLKSYKLAERGKSNDHC